MKCPYCGIHYLDEERECPICGRRANPSHRLSEARRKADGRGARLIREGDRTSARLARTSARHPARASARPIPGKKTKDKNPAVRVVVVIIGAVLLVQFLPLLFGILSLLFDFL